MQHFFKIGQLRQFCSKLSWTISGLMGRLYLLDVKLLPSHLDKSRQWLDINWLKLKLDKFAKIVPTVSDNAFIYQLSIFEFDEVTKWPASNLSLLSSVLNQNFAKSSWQIQMAALSNASNFHLALNCCKHESDGALEH